MSEFASQDRRLDVAMIFVAIADQQGMGVLGKGECDQEFGFAPGFQAEVPAPAAFHQVFHYVALLIALDREHPLITTAVVVVGNCSLEGSMQAFEPVVEDVVEAN